MPLVEGARRKTRVRHRADRIHLPDQCLPECVGIVGAGQATAQADDGDRLVGRLHRHGRHRVGRAVVSPAVSSVDGSLLGQKTRQRCNVRMLPEHHRRDRHLQPDGKRLGPLHRRHRIEAVERKRLFAIDRLGIQPQPRGQFGAQPGLDGRDGSDGSRDGLARRHHGNNSRRRRGRQHRTIPAGHHRQAVLQKIRPALLTADLAAGGTRKAPRLHQHDDVGRHADVHGDGRGHALEHAALDRLAERQLLHDDQLLRVVPIHGKGDRAVLAQLGVAFERRQLHILRINVEAVQDDQIFQTSADVQLALVQETEIAGTQVTLAVGRFRDFAGKAPPSVFGPLPVALRNAGAAYPDLADAAMTGQGDPIALVVGRDHRALLQGRPRKRQTPGLPPEPDAPAERNQQGGLGHAVSSEPGRGIESVRREGCGEFFQRAWAHRLGATGENAQTAQIQRRPLCLRNRADAKVEGEIGRAGDRGAIVRDRLEPAIGVQQERRRPHQHHRAAQHQWLQNAADQAEVVIRRQPVDHDLVAPHLPLRGHCREIGEQVAVGHHDALRGAGGTGRVLQERDTRAVQPGVRPVARVAVGPVDRQPALDRQLFALLRLKCRDPRQFIADGQREPGARINRHRLQSLQAAGMRGRIRRNRNGARIKATEKRADVVEPRIEDQQDGLILTAPASQEMDGDPFGCVAQFGVGHPQRAFVRVLQENIGRIAGPGSGEPFQQGDQIVRFQGGGYRAGTYTSLVLVVFRALERSVARMTRGRYPDCRLALLAGR